MLSCLLLRCAAGGVEGLRSREYANFTAQVRLMHHVVCVGLGANTTGASTIY